MGNLLTAKDVQDLLHVDRSTVYRMAEAGKLPAFKVGHQWRFSANDMTNWMDGQTPVTQNNHFSANLPLVSVQAMLDLTADLLGVMVLLTDMDGKPITKVSNPCGLFELIETSPNGVQHCVQEWQRLAAELDLKPRFQANAVGLLCARGMIRFDNMLSGMVFVGGIAPDQWSPTPERIAQIAQDFDLNPNDVANRFNEVFYRDEADKEHILTHLQRIADVVAHMANDWSIS